MCLHINVLIHIDVNKHILWHTCRALSSDVIAAMELVLNTISHP